MLPPTALEATARSERERGAPSTLAAEESLQRRSGASDCTALAFHLGGMRPCLRLTRRVARSTRSRAPSSRTTTSMPPPAMGLAARRGTARWSAALALAHHSPSPSPEQLAVTNLLTILLTNLLAAQWRRVGGRAHRPDDAARRELLSAAQAGLLTGAVLTMALLSTYYDASFYRLHKQACLLGLYLLWLYLLCFYRLHKQAYLLWLYLLWPTRNQPS